MRPGPRVYNIFPLLAGPIADWTGHLDRIAEMGFDWVFTNPFHEPGFSGSLYAVKDYYKLNPLIRGEADGPDEKLLTQFVRAAEARGLSVMMDLVINHTSKDSVLVREHPAWFLRNADGSLRSPGVTDPTDPAIFTEWGDLAEIDYGERPARAGIIGYWRDVVKHYMALGIRGFRGDAAYKIPAEVWQAVMSTSRAERGGAVFFAETLGCKPEDVIALRQAGFDYIFNSAKWWDFKAPWLLEQYAMFRAVAPSISFPESHDTDRLISDLRAEDITDIRQIEAIYRQRYLFSAVFSTGVMMPMGFEYGFRRRLDVVKTRPSDWEEPAFDIVDFIAATNRMKASIPALNEEGPQRYLETDQPEIIGLHRSTESGDSWTQTVINTDRIRSYPVAANSLVDDQSLGCPREITPGGSESGLAEHTSLRLGPSDLRVFACDPAQVRAAKQRLPRVPGLDRGRDLHSRRIVIQNVYPELDSARYPVKREVGELFEVWADIFIEGHDKLAAVLRHRCWGETQWHETPMELMNPGLDRWRGQIRLEQNARYQYTIEAWHDPYATWLDEAEKKRRAGLDLRLELIEGHAIAAAALERAKGIHRQRLAAVLDEVARGEDPDRRFELLASRSVQKIMRELPDRATAVSYDRELEVTVDRIRARFATWYEMFPRSQGPDGDRGATFKEAAERLAEIRDMGFDVVYLPPIHPIGRAFRKGKNNTLGAAEHDPGSPYAIGSPEGGHDAVHPDLGTLDDFRAFVAEVHRKGMEVALDFAIQASPDHPWLKKHPDWFSYRPDGTIKYAENPPKKYQDIVNVNFFGAHQEALWDGLRQIVLFWIAQGVRIFRVDNPHTKPVPFWEWLIRTVQLAYPDVIFLSESFTRPPMLRMMAKVGFSQSYTYFTWRNTKSELTDYFTELAQGPSAEYLRPNLFPNTPDILPKFLQTGGRPAFQIRFILAATLSGAYGIYSGFELCEADALPNSEEYNNSEKYEYKLWDWDRPGHIKDYIKAVNRLRQDNPALQYLRNLSFHESSDDHVLCYGKTSPAGDNTILIAVNLDPFAVHESELRIPISALGVLEGEEFLVEDLLQGHSEFWRGPTHRIRLDPHRNPAAILRVSSLAQVARRKSALSPTFPRHLVGSRSLQEYVRPRRWFSAKNESLVATDLQTLAEIPKGGSPTVMTVVTASFDQTAQQQRYALPLSVAWQESNPAELEALRSATVGHVRRGATVGVLYDAMSDDGFIRSIIESMAAGRRLPTTDGGSLAFSATSAFPLGFDVANAAIRRFGGEQSNTSVRIGSNMVLKLLRRLQPGIHPELEISRYLTEIARFPNTPGLLGSVIYEPAQGDQQTLAVLNAFVENEGDGWSWTLEYLDRFTGREPAGAGDRDGSDPHERYLSRIHTLGRRTAELHRAFASPTQDPAFAPEKITAKDMAQWVTQVHKQAEQALTALRRVAPTLPAEDRRQAARLLDLRDRLKTRISTSAPRGIAAVKTRIHGDFHLGQVLVGREDFSLVDFEGEPSRTVQQRRAKQSPLRDVVGMLRSFDYAAAATLRKHQADLPNATIARFVEQWRKRAREVFQQGYRSAIGNCPSYPSDTAAAEGLLCLFLLEKALYEIGYEAANRPGWVAIPVQGVLDILEPER